MPPPRPVGEWGAEAQLAMERFLQEPVVMRRRVQGGGIFANLDAVVPAEEGRPPEVAALAPPPALRQRATRPRIRSLSQGLREAIRMAQAPENFTWRGTFQRFYTHIFHPATGYQLRDYMQQFLRGTNWWVMERRVWLWFNLTPMDRQKLVAFLTYFRRMVRAQDLAFKVHREGTRPVQRRVPAIQVANPLDRGMRWIR